jgi:hypothetical protein
MARLCVHGWHLDLFERCAECVRPAVKFRGHPGRARRPQNSLSSFDRGWALSDMPRSMIESEAFRASTASLLLGLAVACSTSDSGSTGESEDGTLGTDSTSTAGAGNTGMGGETGGPSTSPGHSNTGPIPSIAPLASPGNAGGASGGSGPSAGGAFALGGAPVSGTLGGAGGSNAGASAADGGALASGGAVIGAGGGGMGGEQTGGGGASGGFAVLTDTNRDGVVDETDAAGHMEWEWQGSGAFVLANVDDDDEKSEPDASDEIVNGATDELDLARILIRGATEAAPGATGASVSVTAGGAQTRVFEKMGTGWTLVTGPLSQLAPEIELGIEAKQFADAEWDGFIEVRVEVLGSEQASLAVQEVTLRVAPWIMLPQSAQTEVLYISSSTTRLRPDLDAVLDSYGLPPSAASSPGTQDIWFQDTMEIGYTQLPDHPPMHVVMTAQRPNASDDVAITLLSPDMGFISVGTPRQPDDEEDHWMDWMGNLEVTHPVPAYPLGRIYYGRSERTTFHPEILAFLEAQQVQGTFSVYTDWLLIQHVDEVMNFLPDQDGRAKLIIVSPQAAADVMGTGLDETNLLIQTYVDAEIANAKTELGLSDDDIIQLPTSFEGFGTDYVPIWSNPVNSVLAGNTFMIGDTDTPSSVRSDVEQKLGAIGIQVVWVDDSEYHPGGGNVHCGTNTKKTPVCPSFTACLP